ncbi:MULTISPECIES: energy transducer TonB [Pseudoalteromonas]|jgi:TonB family protein|uniref:energy transducer TonB n=1 Tax=Pseudoalteromonas TaxID=53246 RepID=UPI0004632FDD|nr:MULTISPECIES: energy transducer TonB [Pseudoalteromonas]KTF09944.1 hypothetical protein ATS74_12225 [Pseudoalteromonas sp. H103]MBB1299067.1 TonB family protein [Pseudoalteromonas sp. SR41-7]MBB1403639.1 TonB family protein [Pseudoalteromonas sp. SG45-1]MBB1445525.1 TonB family protein [Pseudoalteromonas sp. SG43-3]MBH0030322.1 TonB family protein [Pseudoalteromonas sp. SWYJZ98]|tara:strand:- start:71 stop:478 length:408 start_codon:yes stop_codon:yes gene_type:complete
MKYLVKLYLVLLMVGCTSTIQHELPGEKISTRKAADFNEKSDVPKWVSKNKSLIESHLFVCETCFGHKVQVHINIDDNGYLKFSKIVRSTGQKELEKEALKAIKSSEPFDISYLSEADKKVVQNIIFTFAPEKNT